MKPLGVVGAPIISSFPPSNSLFLQKRLQRQRFCVSCTYPGSRTVEHAKTAASIPEYKPGVFDDLFLNLFRNKLVVEVGWDSNKPGYDGLIEVVNRLMMKARTRADTIEAAVRVLRSLFPPFLLELYKMLIAPIGGGKIAAMMVARVTAVTCQWLMGPCKVNSVDLDNGSSCSSGVYVERCKYLEESKCASICINTCKFPTQVNGSSEYVFAFHYVAEREESIAHFSVISFGVVPVFTYDFQCTQTFFMDHMGVPLLMEPNFSDYSCQFKFGVLPPQPEDDGILKEPCLESCPLAAKRRVVVARNTDGEAPCPKI